MKPNAPTVHVWPWFIRVFHWSLVVLVALLFWTAEIAEEEQWHAYFGYALLVLLLLRCVYGCITSNPFTSLVGLVCNVRRIPSYSSKIFSKNKPRHLGHNPLGGLMVLALLLLLFTQASIGFFLAGEDFDAPLYPYIGDELSYTLSEIHEILFDIIVIAIGLHVTAVIFYHLKHKEPLLQAMIHGKKPKQ